MQYLTAYGAIIDIAGLKSGETVLIPAASSSVGLAAIQIAKMEVLGKWLTIRGNVMMEITGDLKRPERGKQFINEGLAEGSLKPIIALTFSARRDRRSPPLPGIEPADWKGRRYGEIVDGDERRYAQTDVLCLPVPGWLPAGHCGFFPVPSHSRALRISRSCTSLAKVEDSPLLGLVS
jgi:hypothetical protein